MAKGSTNTQRIAALEATVAALQETPRTVAAGITAANLNDRIEQEMKPVNDRLRAFQVILQGYERVLLEHQITSAEIAEAIRDSAKWQELTQAQKEIVGDLLQSL